MRGVANAKWEKQARERATDQRVNMVQNLHTHRKHLHLGEEVQRLLNGAHFELTLLRERRKHVNELDENKESSAVQNRTVYWQCLTVVNGNGEQCG